MTAAARLFLLLALAGPLRAETLFDATDAHYLTRALRALDMTPADLSFKKDHAESAFILPATHRYLHAPATLPVEAGELLHRLRRASQLTEVPAALDEQPRRQPRPRPHRPYTIETAVDAITAAAARIQLPPPNPTALAAFAVEMLPLDADSPALADFPPATRAFLARRDALELADDELARAWIPGSARYSSLLTQPALRELLRILEQVAGDLRHSAPGGDFQRRLDSRLGPIFLGGTGPNTYRDDAFLILDLGGDDVYENHAGGANGLTGLPVAIVLDLGGADRYVTRHSGAQGAGIFGVGILVDVAGDDTYEAGHIAQGSAFFGVGILADFDGADRFEADSHSQGAATFGTGLLWVKTGNTTYQARSLSQGFGGVQGTGLLLDGGGDDSYTATGSEPCAWLPGHKFTLSQGFGYGERPHAGGGRGILADLAGNDRYVADVYGQGASYWYAIGLLLDAAGNDSYQAHQYCQGAGIHLSVGLLADLGGDDEYRAHAICQGGAHDYSVGILADRAGNDRYSGDSTAQGSAINNSFALLLDQAGDDTYTGTDPNQSQAAGHDGGRRQYGSIAVLLDLAGHDAYSQGHTNNSVWLKPFYGCGLDTEATPLPGRSPRTFFHRPARANPARSFSPPYRPVDPHHPTERLLRLALSDKPEAAAAWEQLRQADAESLRYLFSRADSPNVSVRAKLEELVDHLGTNAVPALIATIAAAENDDQARLSAYFLARFPTATNAIPVVLPLLRRDKTRATALYTLGHLRAREAFPAAVRYLRDDKEVVRLRAAQALGRIGDRRAIPHLEPLLADRVWTVRFAARDAIANLRKTP